jgi:cobalt transporter subunit CbtA
MGAFRKLVFTAVIAGLISGGLVTLAHHFGTAQIIARAEVYEKAALDAEQASTPAAHDHATASHTMINMENGSAATEWTPQDGIERTLYTALADMVTAVAFSLILIAAFDLRGGNVDWRTGLFWGLAGFVTFTLAPGLGLPPEVRIQSLGGASAEEWRLEDLLPI